MINYGTLLGMRKYSTNSFMVQLLSQYCEYEKRTTICKQNYSQCSYFSNNRLISAVEQTWYPSPFNRLSLYCSEGDCGIYLSQSMSVLLCYCFLMRLSSSAGRQSASSLLQSYCTLFQSYSYMLRQLEGSLDYLALCWGSYGKER